MTDKVAADLIVSFRNGACRLMRVTNSGRYMVPTKDGEVAMSFAPGDVLIANANDDVIAGPIGLVPAMELAARVLDGDEREITNTMNFLALCAVVIDAGMKQLTQQHKGTVG